MDPLYRDSCREGFYPATERDTPESRQHPQQQQQQQLPHYAHQLPYHAPLLSPLQQTAAYMLEQSEQLRSREDYGSGHATPALLRSLYPGSGSMLPSTSLVLQPPNHQTQHFPGPEPPPPQQQQQQLQLQQQQQHQHQPQQQQQPQHQALRLQSSPRSNYLTPRNDQVTNSAPSQGETATHSTRQPDSAREAIGASPNEPLELVMQRPALLENQSKVGQPAVTAAAAAALKQSEKSVLPTKTSNQPNVLQTSRQQPAGRGAISFLQRLMLQPRAPPRGGATIKSSAQLPDFLTFKFLPGEKENIVGVVAKTKVEDGVEFGPYDGTLMDEEIGSTKESTWEICTGGKVFFYVDGKKKDQLMWLSYVQCARSEEEQNLEVCQYYGQIYFRTTRVIDPGSELRAFYSKEYAKSVGFKIPLKDLNYDKDKDTFQCTSCDRQFPTAKRLLRHIKFDHETDTPNYLQPSITWKMKVVTKQEEVDPPPEEERPEPMVKRKSKAPLRTVSQESGHFVCTVCGKKFPSEGRLEAHAMFHEFNEDYVCLICGEKQRNAKALTRHLAQHDSRQHKCGKCSKAYKTKNALYRHNRDAHLTPPVKGHACRICSVEFVKKSECLKHEKTHGADDPHDGFPSPADEVWKKKKYRLPQGTENNSASVLEPGEIRLESELQGRTQRKRTPKSRVEPEMPKDMLGKSLAYFNKPRPYKCRYCSRRYRSRVAAYEHEKEVHEGKGTYKCNLCPKVFMKECSFLQHYQCHEQNRIYRCTLCPRTFSSDRALNNHQGEHTGLKPFKCEICGKGFRIRKWVCAHKRRMHQTRELRFFCSTCNKGFTDKGPLQKHELRHKGIRPFVCLICGKGFGVKYVLQVHMQSVHSEEKQYGCEICGKRFALNQHYIYHMFKHKSQGEDLPKGVDEIGSQQQQEAQPTHVDEQN